jgi:hypothetical protein
MSKVYADAITTIEASQDLTLGGSGDNVIVTAGATLKTNTVKDSGGNTLWTSDGSGNLSSVNTALGGNMVLLSTQTASNAASVSFTSGIDSTYKLYIFKFYDVNPATDEAEFTFQANAVGASGYNETITSTFFRAIHDEANTTATLGYYAPWDQAQGTAFQVLAGDNGNDADASVAGELHLFNPSNTTYVKHFYSRFQANSYGDWSSYQFTSGYFNTTTAIDDMQFKMSSGNMDAVIKMYGLG